jgi:hypothetical protein
MTLAISELSKPVASPFRGPSRCRQARPAPAAMSHLSTLFPSPAGEIDLPEGGRGRRDRPRLPSVRRRPHRPGARSKGSRLARPGRSASARRGTGSGGPAPRLGGESRALMGRLSTRECGRGGFPVRRPQADEFLPLPQFFWDSRPETLPISLEEAETAIFLANGDLNAAAARLKVTRVRLNKPIRKYAQLQRLIAALAEPDQKLG